MGIYGAELAKQYPDKFAPLASLPLPEIQESIQEIRYSRPTLVTIHPTLPWNNISGIAEELPGPVMEYFFETTRTVVNLLLKGTLRKYPNLRFIVPHGGAFLTILSDRLIPLAGLLLFDLLRMVTNESHLLYGSDSPFTLLPVCVSQAEQMDQKSNDTLAEQIYQNNPKLLFKEVGILG